VLVGWYESEKFENDPPIKGAKLIDETEKHATDYDSIILGKTYKYELPNSKLIPKHIFEIFLESDWEDWEDDQGGGICSFRISVKKPSV
jgi:hypothetical protein